MAVPVCHSNSGGVFAGLAAATEQLPVVGDSKTQSEAQMLLDACQAAQADTWALPLALILEDVNCLAGACTHPLAAVNASPLVPHMVVNEADCWFGQADVCADFCSNQRKCLLWELHSLCVHSVLCIKLPGCSIMVRLAHY